jgi:flagella basal body P-ring formation protein FlgA
MMRPISATIVLLFALVLAGGSVPGGTALAQSVLPPPALRASVTVTSDVVRIGDLVENAGPVADVPIFRSPDLGTTGAVSTDRIVEAIRPHQLIGIDTRGLAQVTVTRASRAITPDEISARIAKALAGQFGFGDVHNIQLNFDREIRTLQVEPDATGELQVLSLSYDPRSTRFDVSLGLPSSVEMRRQATHYTGTAIATVDALAVNHPIERGHVLKASDIVVLRRPKSDTTALTDMSTVVGLAARRALQPNQSLNANDLMKPEIVARNDTVTLVYQVPGVTLTLRGQAQEAGALGDTISVLNVESKRVVQAVVSGPDRVTVGPVTTRLVDNATATSQ